MTYDLFEDELYEGDLAFEDPSYEDPMGELDELGDFEGAEGDEDFESVYDDELDDELGDFEGDEVGFGTLAGGEDLLVGELDEEDFEATFWDSEATDLTDYQIIGADTRKYVKNARRVPWRYICAVQIKVKGRWMNNGTATLVGPRTVLTAGHVFHHNKGYPMRVVPAAKGLLVPFGATAVKSAAVYPGYAPATSTDIALMYLSRPLGGKVGYWSPTLRKTKRDPRGTAWYTGTPSSLKNVNLSGYPNDRPFKATWKCRSGPAGTCGATSPWSSTRGHRCGKFQYWAWNKVNTIVSGLIRYQNDTCAGHSGSPVWIAPKGQPRKLVAVHISGSPTANAAVLLTAAKQKWLRARIK